MDQNPIRKIIMPNKTSHPRRDIENIVYSKQELEEFLAAAKEYDITAYTFLNCYLLQD